jgi:hypothetical protein
MMHLLSVLPTLACIAVMFGAGTALRLATRTPLARVPWIARRAHRQPSQRADDTRA